MRLTLATENGKRVGRTSKAKRLAAAPAVEAARLRRCIAVIRAEAEQSQARAKAAEAVVEAAFKAACGTDPLIARALAREALIEVHQGLYLYRLVRTCEMAEEGTLCA